MMRCLSLILMREGRPAKTPGCVFRKHFLYCRQQSQRRKRERTASQLNHAECFSCKASVFDQEGDHAIFISNKFDSSTIFGFRKVYT